MMTPMNRVLRGAPNVPWASFLIAAVTLYDFESVDPKLRVKDTPTNEIHPEYDFIVVGAGSAGSVVASRLSEVSDWRVLLLEAGGDETVITDVPRLFPFLQNTYLDWQFKTEPSNTACLAMPGARCAWPRGKVLGGSSTLNVMTYNRGNKKDYDLWESLGNPGWGYDDVLPYFLKSEDIRIPELRNSPYHSTGGPLTVSRASYRSAFGPAFLQAWEELGYPTRDNNGEFQTGFMIPQATIRDGHRCSTAKAFLRPARHRHNLQIAMHSYVTKVLINPTTKTAYGVEFARNGNYYTVNAQKEVILSAGALQSPQLLMLSGIGPEKHLQKLRIPVLQDLKVGYNLQDHIKMPELHFVIDKPVLSTDKRLEINTAVLDYAKLGTGVLTLPFHEALGNIFTSYANTSDDWPDVQITVFPIIRIETNKDEHVCSSTKAGDPSAPIAVTQNRDRPAEYGNRNSFRPIATKIEADDSAEDFKTLLRPSRSSRPSPDFSRLSRPSSNMSRPSELSSNVISFFKSSPDLASLTKPSSNLSRLSRPSSDTSRPSKLSPNVISFSKPSPDLSSLSKPPSDLSRLSRSSSDPSRPSRPSSDLSSLSHDAWGINVFALRPKSRGRVFLRSKNPLDYPIFIPNYFTEPIDLLTLVAGIKIALRIGNTSAMQQFGSKFNYTNPNCENMPLYSDAYWECAIRFDSETVYHQVGTCKMGPKSDPGAVVDPQLRVYGVKRLRVIDGSIMPTLTSGNTNAPIIMIGEKGADFIKNAWISDYVVGR